MTISSYDCGQGTDWPRCNYLPLADAIDAMAAWCSRRVSRLSIAPRSLSSDAITKSAPTGTQRASAIFVTIDKVGSRLLFSSIDRYETEHSARVATSACDTPRRFLHSLIALPTFTAHPPTDPVLPSTCTEQRRLRVRNAASESLLPVKSCRPAALFAFLLLPSTSGAS